MHILHCIPYYVTYDVACLALWERRERLRVELAMSQHHLLLWPLDPRLCLMVCTPWFRCKVQRHEQFRVHFLTLERIFKRENSL
jgi:hypothetical protein